MAHTPAAPACLPGPPDPRGRYVTHWLTSQGSQSSFPLEALTLPPGASVSPHIPVSSQPPGRALAFGSGSWSSLLQFILLLSSPGMSLTGWCAFSPLTPGSHCASTSSWKDLYLPSSSATHRHSHQPFTHSQQSHPASKTQNSEALFLPP